MGTTQQDSTDAGRPAGTPPAPLSLPSVLDLSAAAGLRDQCLDVMAAGGDLVIDISGVSNITTPCVQVLLATEKSLAADGRALRVVGESSRFAEAFADLGLEERYRMWSVGA